jgi:hypothetical protein
MPRRVDENHFCDGFDRRICGRARLNARLILFIIGNKVSHKETFLI